MWETAHRKGGQTAQRETSPVSYVWNFGPILIQTPGPGGRQQTQQQLSQPTHTVLKTSQTSAVLHQQCLLLSPSFPNPDAVQTFLESGLHPHLGPQRSAAGVWECQKEDRK